MTVYISGVILLLSCVISIPFGRLDRDLLFILDETLCEFIMLEVSYDSGARVSSALQEAAIMHAESVTHGNVFLVSSVMHFP